MASEGQRAADAGEACEGARRDCRPARRRGCFCGAERDRRQGRSRPPARAGATRLPGSSPRARPARRRCACSTPSAAHAGLKPLKRNKKLQNAAQQHNDEMVGTGCFDHECPGESDLGERLDQIGYLVGGLSRVGVRREHRLGLSPRRERREQIIAAWMNSDAHRANILNPKFREVGIGFHSRDPRRRRRPGRHLHHRLRPPRPLR